MNYTGLIIICAVVFVTCLILLNLDRIKMFFSSLKFKKNLNKKPKEKKGKSKDETPKLKASETQIRPILKPPEEKMIEAPKIENDLDKFETKNSFAGEPVRLNKDNVLDFSSSYTPHKNSKFKTREELDKEFDEIRDFLSLPQASNPSSKPTINRLPSNTSHFRTPLPVGQIENKNIWDESSIPVRRKTTNSIPKINIDNTESMNEYDKKIKDYTGRKNIIKVDGDEIDLNKLPPKLRKILLMNVFARKDFD